MKIGIVDAEVMFSKKNHRFPNLASMKISSYHKKQGDEVKLLLSPSEIANYDKVYISMVFTDTPIDRELLELPNVVYGGTGFFFDQAPPLPDEVEHSMPDYHLYDEWVAVSIEKGKKKLEQKIEEMIERLDPKEAIEREKSKLIEGYRATDLQYYTDYSIGYLTRDCFRKCSFCVNKSKDRVKLHSPITEFLEPTRKKIALLDDNFLGHPQWKELLSALQGTNKPFQFRQGLDERILTEEKAEMLANSKYDGELTFAFDNITDMELIRSKINLIHTIQKKKSNIRFFVLCGYDHEEKYDEAFWAKDIRDTFERISFLIEYGCRPYIMKHKNFELSPYRGTYINLGRWANRPRLFKKMSYEEFVFADSAMQKCESPATLEYYKKLKEEQPEIAEKYYRLKYNPPMIESLKAVEQLTLTI